MDEQTLQPADVVTAINGEDVVPGRAFQQSDYRVPVRVRVQREGRAVDLVYTPCGGAMPCCEGWWGDDPLAEYLELALKAVRSADVPWTTRELAARQTLLALIHHVQAGLECAAAPLSGDALDEHPEQKALRDLRNTLRLAQQGLGQLIRVARRLRKTEPTPLAALSMPHATTLSECLAALTSAVDAFEKAEPARADPQSLYATGFAVQEALHALAVDVAKAAASKAAEDTTLREELNSLPGRFRPAR